MDWYYVEDGQQIGPVTDDQLPQLHQSGKINDETLVWREGLTEWTPYRQIKPALNQLPPGAPPLPVPPSLPQSGEAVCAECHKIFPADETIRYGTVNICATCKPVFLQKLAEGGRSRRDRAPAAGRDAPDYELELVSDGHGGVPVSQARASPTGFLNLS